MFRTALVSTSGRTLLVSTARAFHTSPVAAKTVTEKVKEAADTVNKKVGKTLASGIEKGEEVAEKTKKTVGGSSVGEVADSVNKGSGRTLASAIGKGEAVTEKAQQATGNASQKAKEQSTVASQKANQTAAGVREGVHDLKRDVEKEARK